MHALILAGGAGSRLNLGEKPLVGIRGRPMIAYVIGAFRHAGCSPVVATSPCTPMTANWCRANGIEVCPTAGAGYIEDMVAAVTLLEEENPLFVSMSDLPCITGAIIQVIRSAYDNAGKDACSTWVPTSLMQCRQGMPCRAWINGTEACPAGLNILRGDLIREPQDELQFLLSDPGLALNVNTPADRAAAEEFLRWREG